MSAGLARLFIAFLISMCCTAATAHDEGPYLGVTAGQSKARDIGTCAISLQLSTIWGSHAPPTKLT